MMITQRIRDLVEDLRGQSLSELASRLAFLLAQTETLTVGITGPSSVGKTYFANDLARSLKSHDRTVTTIGSDSFLLPHLRGAGSFRTDTARPLIPEDFDVATLAACIGKLRQGAKCDYSTYVRGIGWQGSRTVGAADIILVEGLFLDSIYFLRQISLEVVLVLFANEQLIAKWRRERDEKVQQSMARPFRNWVETEREIERTQLADELYAREPSPHRLVLIEIDAERKVFDFTE